MDFYFTRTATELVRRLSDQFSRVQDHILLKNRLKNKEVKNSAYENLNREYNLSNSFDVKFSYSTANLIFFGFLIILLILPIFDRHKIGKFQTQKSLLGIRL